MPELVAPIIPDAQKNRSPDILFEGLRTGLAAFAQFAELRRRSESEVARLALQEKLAGEEHALSQQRMAQDYELRDRTLSVAEEMLPFQKQASEAQTQLSTEHAKAYAEGTATAAQMKAEAVRQKNLLLKEVSDNARELKLDDPHFQTKEPMAFAKNVMDFERMYHLSPLPEVRQAIKAYRTVADSQKLFIKHGVDDGTGAIKGTGNGRQVPAWRIVANANNPATREQTLRDLEASGYTELVESLQQFTNKDGGKVDVPTKTRVLRQPVKSMVEESQTLESPLSDAAPVAAPAPTPPDYGPDAETPQYPIGTRGKRGGQWFVLTDEGWKPE